MKGPDTPGRIQLSFRKHGTFYMVDSRVTWVDDTWYHYALTWGADGIKLYINGELKAENPVSRPFADGSTLDFHIGSGSIGTQDFKGALDDLRIYKKVLSPQEVLDVYQGR